MLFINQNTIHRTHLLALRLVVVADALGAFAGLDFINLVALVDGIIRAFRFAYVAIDALIGNKE